jgi:GntR family transcriptional repressor for pyruvate dehydrogenase complex
MEPVERVSVLAQVVDRLISHITEGNVAIGEKMPSETKLAAILGVGRSTVREAYRVLEARGFLKMQTGKGAYIARIKERSREHDIHWFAEHGVELAEFVEVRMGIEPLSAKLAAERATKKEIKEMGNILDLFEKAVREKDGTQLAILDDRFHRSIVESSKNLLLCSISDKIAECFLDYRCRVYSVSGYAAHAIEPHRSILRAISNRDGKLAELKMLAHLKEILQDLGELSETARA